MPIGKPEVFFCVMVLALFSLPALAAEKETETGKKLSAQSATTPPTTPVFWASPHSQSASKIEKVLQSPMKDPGLKFDEAPLEEIVAYLRDEYEIEVQIDIPALDSLGLEAEEPITCNLHNISLGAALRFILKQLNLAYVTVDEVLLITSEEEALEHSVVAIYPVGDLLAAANTEPGMGGGVCLGIV